MSAILNLAYLVVESSKPVAWRAFCDQVLGLPPPRMHPDGSLGWQVDERSQRLLVQAGHREDLAALGFECTGDAALDTLVARLARAGHAVEAATEALCATRCVRRLMTVRDPDGNAVELCTGLAKAQRPFVSSAFPQGFQTGELGLGHAVLVSGDTQKLEAFYVDLLGFGVTERLGTRVGPIDVRGVFLHCNRRHHSLAIFDLPLARRLHHFMLQAPSIHDIGLAHERARKFKVPVSMGLGQHPAPDGTFSFYGETPSGFDFEIGAGTHEIDPHGWQVRHTQHASAWGHKPGLRLQLRMASGLVRQKLLRRRNRQAEAAR
ncbi:biphenyl-2,3-diol 1,2-dioxygenase [Variovorax beijingensis]|uniref:Biphenyl-2,3-diol 1,2-dioxygenase n=1 Tax=Variovorax beijingensis TaxID=2496117 RepID=A0A561C3M8_9BURK|nr:VOC family protein [Variovorax beijingensis]TWD85776.1 biphenyl-2,3-diol 1,2-dioxygenase [Variovorax beijingensis]